MARGLNCVSDRYKYLARAISTKPFEEEKLQRKSNNAEENEQIFSKNIIIGSA
jgi:hypothetical protein